MLSSALEQNLVQRVAVGDIFRRRATATPHFEAVSEQRGDQTLRLTFRELNNRLNQFARALRARGFEKGDRIGLLGLNSTEYLIALYGCAKGGYVAVPINPGLNPKDVGYILGHAEVTGLVVDDILFPLIAALKDTLTAIKLKVAILYTGAGLPDDYEEFNAMIADQSEDEVEDVIIEDRDTFEILYTSGTTADPKGVLISHLTVFIMSLTNSIEIKVALGSVGTTLMPLFHCAQQTFSTTFFHVGGKTVILRGFDPAVMLDTIAREKLQVMFALPAMYRAMLDHPRLQAVDVSSMQRCVYAMAPMDQRTLEDGIRAFGAEFFLGTGQTECFPSTNSFRGEFQLTKKGNYWGESAVTLDTAVMDDEGNLMPQGQVGEIVWRGPGTMQGYLKNEAATAASRRFGWHHSGDLGYYDEDNLLVFVDRKKDMIKTGGENVPSVKVERTLLANPAIAAAAVVGLPNERWVEAVTAFVVATPGMALNEADVINAAKAELGGFEVPKKVVIVDQLPLTSTGKIKKNVIRDNYQSLYKEQDR